MLSTLKKKPFFFFSLQCVTFIDMLVYIHLKFYKERSYIFII